MSVQRVERQSGITCDVLQYHRATVIVGQIIVLNTVDVTSAWREHRGIRCNKNIHAEMGRACATTTGDDKLFAPVAIAILGVQTDCVVGTRCGEAFV